MRILIADDKPEYYNDLTSAIERERPQDEIVFADNAMEAHRRLNSARDRPFDLLILDEKMGGLLFDTGLLEEKDNRLIVISDHGFCSFGEAKMKTLPEETEHGRLKGDHHENALLITVNLDHEIDTPQDIFHAILSATK